MKQLTYLLIFVASFGYSQSNLVFNQVLNFRLNNATTVTVPDGKVWKVEHASGPNSNSLIASNQETSYGLPLNSSSYHLLSTQNNNATWFSEGTILSSGTSCILSILEFDVVPISGGNDSGGTGTGGSGTGTTDFSTPGGGQSYGDDFTPSDPLTDNDGNVYETVQIGDQIWTTSNLNVSTYSDGTPIPYITDKNEWLNTYTGAYTYYLQNESLGYGKIYNAAAVMGIHDSDPNTPNKKLAPEGYHIPNVFEWDQLFNFYGGIESAGIYLKSETSWGFQGNNQSGLDIKKNGWIGLGCTNASTNIGFLGTGCTSSYTMIATSDYTADGYLKLKSVVFSDDVDFQFYYHDPVSAPSFVGYSEIFHWPYQDRVNGTYVRLIKD